MWLPEVLAALVDGLPESVSATGRPSCATGPDTGRQGARCPVTTWRRVGRPGMLWSQHEGVPLGRAPKIAAPATLVLTNAVAGSAGPARHDRASRRPAFLFEMSVSDTARDHEARQGGDRGGVRSLAGDRWATSIPARMTTPPSATGDNEQEVPIDVSSDTDATVARGGLSSHGWSGR